EWRVGDIDSLQERKFRENRSEGRHHGYRIDYDAVAVIETRVSGEAEIGPGFRQTAFDRHGLGGEEDVARDRTKRKSAIEFRAARTRGFEDLRVEAAQPKPGLIEKRKQNALGIFDRARRIRQGDRHGDAVRGIDREKT